MLELPMEERKEEIQECPEGTPDTNLNKENLDLWVPPSVEKRDGAEAKRIS